LRVCAVLHTRARARAAASAPQLPMRARTLRHRHARTRAHAAAGAHPRHHQRFCSRISAFRIFVPRALSLLLFCLLSPSLSFFFFSLCLRSWPQFYVGRDALCRPVVFERVGTFDPREATGAPGAYNHITFICAQQFTHLHTLLRCASESSLAECPPPIQGGCVRMTW
jgi:hypothetical protein